MPTHTLQNSHQYSHQYSCFISSSCRNAVHFFFHFAMIYGLSLVILYFTFLECFSLGHEVYFTAMFGKNNSSKDGYIEFLNNVNAKVSDRIDLNSSKLTNKNDEKRYFISQKDIHEIVKSVNAYKFFLPQLRVADPTLTYSDAMVQIFTRYNSNDILTQVAIELESPNKIKQQI